MTNDPGNPTTDPNAGRPSEAPEPAPPKPDGPPEVEDAARQELEYPEDETNEG